MSSIPRNARSEGEESDASQLTTADSHESRAGILSTAVECGCRNPLGGREARAGAFGLALHMADRSASN